LATLQCENRDFSLHFSIELNFRHTSKKIKGGSPKKILEKKNVFPKKYVELRTFDGSDLKKFAASVIDTGDKFAAGVVDTSRNLPPLSLTLVANLPLVMLILVVHLDLQISPRILEQI
jgi:hypothetical protein